MCDFCGIKKKGSFRPECGIRSASILYAKGCFATSGGITVKLCTSYLIWLLVCTTHSKSNFDTSRAQRTTKACPLELQMHRFTRQALCVSRLVMRKLGFVVMRHSYDYISRLLPCFDIAVRLGNLFQRIASIYDRFNLSRLNKLFEEN